MWAALDGDLLCAMLHMRGQQMANRERGRSHTCAHAMLDTRVFVWSHNPTVANTQQCKQGHAQSMIAHPLLRYRSIGVCLAAHPTTAQGYSR